MPPPGPAANCSPSSPWPSPATDKGGRRQEGGARAVYSQVGRGASLQTTEGGRVPGPGHGRWMPASADQSVLTERLAKRLRLLWEMLSSHCQELEADLPQPGSMGSNPEQARTGAPAQHCQQAPGSPPSVTWQTPAHPASHTQAHFPTPQTPSSSPGVETQRGKWEPSLPYAGGRRPPQVGTKAGDLQEGMGEPQAVWDTSFTHLGPASTGA